MTITMRLIALLIFCSLLVGANLNAQSAWLPPTDGSSVTVEAYRFDKPSGNRTANGTTMFLTARIRENSNLTFVLELPLFRPDERRGNNASSTFRHNSRTTVGNPYFGVAIGDNISSSFTLDLGLRMPMATQNRGFTPDFDRWEAFAPELFLVSALVGGHFSAPKSSVSGSIRVGPTMLSSAEKNADFFLDYETGLWFTTGSFTFGSLLSGRIPLTDEQSYQIADQTESADSRPIVSDQSEFLIGFTGDIKIGSLRPGVSARFPIVNDRFQSLSSSMHAIYGANITWLFGGKNRDKTDWR